MMNYEMNYISDACAAPSNKRSFINPDDINPDDINADGSSSRFACGSYYMKIYFKM
jgi:hypothetical protein